MVNLIIEDNWGLKVLQWLTLHYLEVMATLTGFLYLFYSIEEKKWLWIYGLITSGMYVYICFDYGIYADMGINIYYVIVSVYGWIAWTSRNTKTKEVLHISNTGLKEGLVLLFLTMVSFILIAYILKTFTDSTIPYWDAFTTSASITATWMLARKKIEHWLIWIVVDAISVGLYIYKGLYPTSLLFLVYTILAAVGYIEWRKKWLIQTQVL